MSLTLWQYPLKLECLSTSQVAGCNFLHIALEKRLSSFAGEGPRGRGRAASRSWTSRRPLLSIRESPQLSDASHVKRFAFGEACYGVTCRVVRPLFREESELRSGPTASSQRSNDFETWSRRRCDHSVDRLHNVQLAVIWAANFLVGPAAVTCQWLWHIASRHGVP